MNKHARIPLQTIAWALLALPLLTAAQSAHPPTVLRIDPSASAAEFAVRLVWLQTIHGHFHDVRGSVRIDPGLDLARVAARIPVASVQVQPAHYRKRLLGKAFFDAGRYPSITFTSSEIATSGLRPGGHLKGRLRMHGVTRPTTLQVMTMRCPQTGLAGCTIRLRGWLDRTRFGMRAYRALVSRRVQLNLTIRLMQPAVQDPITLPAAAHSAPDR